MSSLRVIGLIVASAAVSMSITVMGYQYGAGTLLPSVAPLGLLIVAGVGWLTYAGGTNSERAARRMEMLHAEQRCHDSRSGHLRRVD